MVVVYIILGMLYESFMHPLTILSTLPSAVSGITVSDPQGGLRRLLPRQRHHYALANPDAKIEIQGYAVIASK